MTLSPTLRRLTVGAALTGLAALVAVTGMGALRAQAQTTDSATDDLFAVIGARGAVHVSADGGVTYRNLGGLLVGDPSIARAEDGRTYIVAQSPNGGLYVRTLDQGWRRLAPAAAVCSDPDVKISNNALQIACRGGNNALYYGRAPLSATGLPAVKSFTKLGGVLTRGPAIIPDSEDEYTSFVVVGRPYGARRDNVYGAFLESRGYFNHYDLTCSDSPSYADNIDSPGIVLACADADGALYYEATLVQDGYFLYTTGNIPGDIRGRPGLTLSEDASTATATVTGVDGHIYRAEITAADDTQTPFRRVNGTAVSGVGATRR